MTHQPDLPNPARAPLATMALVALLLVVTRLLDLGRQSPWNDEVMCWMWARELGEGGSGNPAHMLTYQAQRLFLAINDSITFLRLPGALASIAGTLGITAWLARRDWRLAAVAGGLMALNPFLIFHAQDANHYGWSMLGAAAVLVGTGAFWSDARASVRWLALVACAAVAVVVVKAHPVNALLAAGFGVTLLGDALRRPGQWPGLSRLDVRRARWGVALAAVVVGALLVRTFHVRAIAMPFIPVPTSIHFSLTPAFQGRFLGNMVGQYPGAALGDALLGLLAAVLAITGWWRGARRDASLAGPAIVGATLFAAVYVVFLLYDFTRSFHVRYVAFLVPWVLVGWALALLEALHLARGTITGPAASRWVLGTAAVVSLLLFLSRLAPWAGSYYFAHYQPVVPAMEWAARNLPPDAILATRAKYLAASTRFLNEQLGVGLASQRYVYLGEQGPYSRMSAQNARVLAARHPGRVFLFDQGDFEDAIKQDYAAFRAERAVELARFSSHTIPDWLGADRSIVIHAVPPDPMTGTLPMIGADAHLVAPLDTGLYPARTRGTLMPALIVSRGTSAAWWIRKTGAPDVLEFDLSTNTPNGSRAWFVAQFDDRPPVVWEFSGEPERVRAHLPLDWDSALAEDGALVRVTVARSFPQPTDTHPHVTVVGLRAPTDQRTRLAEPLAGPPAVLSPEPGFAHAYDGGTWQFQPGPGDNGVLASADLPATPPATPLVLAWRYGTTGLTEGIVRARVLNIADADPLIEAGRDTSWTGGELLWAAVLEPTAWQAGRAPRWQLNLQNTVVYGPHGGEVTGRGPWLFP